MSPFRLIPSHPAYGTQHSSRPGRAGLPGPRSRWRRRWRGRFVEPAPVASFTATPTVGQIPLVVAFNAAASSDPDGSISTYSWNFGDGGTGSGVAPSHTYATAGTFTVTLTVTDNLGATDSTIRTVTTTAGPPPASVTVSGRITFERVPFSTALGGGLDFTSLRSRHRRARSRSNCSAVEHQAVLATVATDTNGNYSFTRAPEHRASSCAPRR